MVTAKTAFLEPITKIVPLSHAPAPLRVLIVVPEVSPYASVGGVSRVAAHLSKELVNLGHDVRIFMPKYGFIDEEEYPLEMVVEGLKVYTGAEGKGPKELLCNVKTHLSKSGVRTYFLENMEYYEKRANVYGYSDDPIRFVLLCRGALEFLRHFEWKPQVIHANDWQTGAMPNLLRTTYAKSKDLAGIAAVFTIHNLFYQGMFDHRQISELDFDDGRSPIAPLFSERLKNQNFIRRGIIYSDAVNTVSETYAREILTPEYGEGLDKLLLEVRSKLFGIINGIDYDDLNPKTDPLVPYSFGAKSLSQRKKNKIALQKEFSLPEGEEHFALGMVSRLSEQKGLEILLEALPHFLSAFDAQFFVIGGGEEKYASAFRDLKKRFPDKIGTHLMPNFTLPRLLFSGVDCLTVPSRFEPAGLTQLEAMRYGAIPIVRKTGGLADTVQDLNVEEGLGTGFVFEEYDPWALFAQLVRAHESFRYPKVWEALVKRALEADFSWGASAEKYAELYRKAIQLRNRDEAAGGKTTLF
ncbi:MAG: glycogen synthase GlgA [Patescibacteria group bacterium]|nr:MAG: glycogen synthase GlgA [Patescibacteria group bacterium]